MRLDYQTTYSTNPLGARGPHIACGVVLRPSAAGAEQEGYRLDDFRAVDIRASVLCSRNSTM